MANEVNGSILYNVDEQALIEELGISSRKHRNTILSSISELKDVKGVLEEGPHEDVEVGNNIELGEGIGKRVCHDKYGTGQGTFKWKDGSTYRGEFKEGDIFMG